MRRPWASLFAASASLALVASPWSLAAPPALARSGEPAAVVPGVTLDFPRDFGSHPAFGIEWWYVTGWLTSDARRPLGFQITFFRVRETQAEDNPSSFATTALLIGHCALTDPAHARFWQAQRIRRSDALGLAGASVGDTDVWMDAWRLHRLTGDPAHSVYEASIDAPDFTLKLTLRAQELPMLNGMGGFSQKGPAPRSASEYYSVPQLAVSGQVLSAGHLSTVSGIAWLDHEWASEYLDPNAQGWDWVGINRADGGAAMGFEIRDHQGRRYWAGGTLRDAHGHIRALSPDEVQFTPLEWWRSPHSAVRYPVAERVRLGDERFDLAPLMADQEFDARASARALYWEGAVQAYRGTELLGRGYLELTGYDRPLSLR